MKKGLLIGIGGVAVLIVAVVIFFISSIDSIIKQVVEEVGSKTTKTEVSLSAASVSLSDGRAALRGLTVGNPAGFKTDSAFSLGEISVTLDAANTTDKQIVIKEIAINAPQVTYEIGSNGSNIDAIQKNVESATGGSSGGSSAKSGDEGPKLIIDNLYVRSGKIRVSAPLMGGKTMDASLPTIHLKDIGRDKGGASPAEVAQQVIAKLTSGVGNVIGGLDLSSITDVAGKAADMAKGAAGEAAKAVEGAAGGAGDAAKGAADAASGAMKKMFGK